MALPLIVAYRKIETEVSENIGKLKVNFSIKQIKGIISIN
jgi:hypothetical protein